VRWVVLRADWLTSRPIAHRGLHDAAAGRPENSLAAFDRAAAAGYPVELDVQLSSDGTPVVFHDDELKRMTGRTGRITRRSSHELRHLPLLGSDQRIPSLADVLSLIAGKVPLIIEIKSRRSQPGPLETAVAHALGDYRGACAVCSFNVATVAWVARHLPNVPYGQNVMNFRETGFRRATRRPSFRDMLVNRASRPQFIGCHTGAVPHPTAERLRGKGIPLIVFTVRNRQQHTLAKKYADNTFFEGFIP